MTREELAAVASAVEQMRAKVDELATVVDGLDNGGARTELAQIRGELDDLEAALVNKGDPH